MGGTSSTIAPGAGGNQSRVLAGPPRGPGRGSCPELSVQGGGREAATRSSPCASPWGQAGSACWLHPEPAPRDTGGGSQDQSRRLRIPLPILPSSLAPREEQLHPCSHVSTLMAPGIRWVLWVCPRPPGTSHITSVASVLFSQVHILCPLRTLATKQVRPSSAMGFLLLLKTPDTCLL